MRDSTTRSVFLFITLNCVGAELSVGCTQQPGKGKNITPEGFTNMCVESFIDISVHFDTIVKVK
jgi:hypothetical protein